MIRAIGTRYAGCFFRSRLEARWAIVFDVLGIRWEYEADGYQLRSGPYLPDFRLPAEKCFVEVKPQPSSRPELVKAYELASEVEAEGWRFLLLESEIPRSAERLPEEFYACLLGHRFAGCAEQQNRAVQAAFDCGRSARFEHGQKPDLAQAQGTVSKCLEEVGDIQAQASYEEGWCFCCAGHHTQCAADNEDVAELESGYERNFDLDDLPEEFADRLEVLVENHYEHHHADCNYCSTCGCEGARCSLSAIRDD